MFNNNWAKVVSECRNLFFLHISSTAVSGASIFLFLAPGDYAYWLSMVQSLELGPAIIVGLKYLISLPVCYHYINGIRHLVSILICYLFCSRLLKYNSKLYSDKFTVKTLKLSEYNFQCSWTIFGGLEHQLLYFHLWLFHLWKYCVLFSLGEIYIDLTLKETNILYLFVS